MYTSLRKVAAEHANIPTFIGLVKYGQEPVSELVMVGLTRMRYVIISVDYQPQDITVFVQPVLIA